MKLWLLFFPAILFSLRLELIPDCKERARDTHFEYFWQRCHDFTLAQGGEFGYTILADVRPGRKRNKEDVDAIILWNLPEFVARSRLYALPREKLFLFLAEPPTVNEIQYDKGLIKRFKKIFTWNDDLVDNIYYFKFYYPVLRPPIEKEVPFRDKKFSCMIVGKKSSNHPLELYSKRLSIIKKLEHSGLFDLYGVGWERSGIACYKGPCDKIKVASHYKFAFCIENMGGVKGYVTEKIFDAFASLTIPIYEGASNIEMYVPQDCFIDLAKFSNIEELIDYLHSIDEETYNGYISRIKDYLKSKKAQNYSTESFLKLFKKEFFK
jgi:hypothetical protein